MSMNHISGLYWHLTLVGNCELVSAAHKISRVEWRGHKANAPEGDVDSSSEALGEGTSGCAKACILP